MNKNKGIIGLGLILAIVLGIVVVGGGAYYLGKSGFKQEVKSPENVLPNNENQNLQPVVDKTQTQTDCTSNSPSTIKVISPNGGEIYKAGEKITVKWESCNVDTGTTAMHLIKRDSSKPYDQRMGVDDHSILSVDVNDLNKVVSGNRTNEIIIPQDLDSTLPYYILINGNGDATNIGSGYGPQDFSDKLFTINSTTIADLQLTESNSGKIINSVKGQVISVTLCNPGDSGYQFDTPQYDSIILNLLNHTNVPIDKGNPPVTGGCYGNDVFKFQTLKIGTSKLNITASRGSESESIFSSTIIVK